MASDFQPSFVLVVSSSFVQWLSGRTNMMFWSIAVTSNGVYLTFWMIWHSFFKLFSSLCLIFKCLVAYRQRNFKGSCCLQTKKLYRVLLGMGPRYVISVTKNEARNEAGCYQNRIASHFNLAAGLCRAAISPF